MNNLTLIIPAKNEKESLPEVLEELKKYPYDISVVLEENDKETINAIKNFNCRIIYQNGKGFGDALIQGINETQTKFFCIFNADGSFNPIELEAMLKKVEEDSYDFIFASRYEKDCGSDDDTVVTLVGNYIFTLIGKIFFKLKISDILYTFVIGKTELAKQLNLKSPDFKLCVELPIKVHRKKFKYVSYPCYERKRIAGIKKVSPFLDGFRILLGMFYLFFKR